MRRKKIQMIMTMLVAAALLGGCGEKPYELTEQEEQLIVNYSAHVVTKYNTYQKEGLSYVWEEDAEASVPAEEHTGEPEDALTQEQTDTPPAAPAPENSAADAALPTATLTELFGENGIEVDYVGARLAASYVESSYYAQYPDADKQYLILGIDLTNTGELPMALDYLNDASEFQVTLNGTVTSSAELTFLAEDFSTFEGTLEAGEIRETVLLFQVPAEVASVDSVELTVTGENNYRIILGNE